jgi:hypothetical protein
MPLVTEPGIHELTHDQYHADSYPAPALSCGVIKNLILKSPLHAYLDHPALNKPDDPFDELEEKADSKFDVGSAAHAMLLEGEERIYVVDCDDWKKPANREDRDQARANGFLPLHNKEYARTKRMVEVALVSIANCEELGISDLRRDGKSEQSFIWREGDIWCKCRPDWISNDYKIILDYKTTGKTAKPDGIDRHILQMGYDIQDAWYRGGAYTLTGETPRFVFMFQEDKEPHLCSFVTLSPEFQEFGEKRIAKGFSLWQKCLGSGEWPGYPKQVCWVDLPAWAAANWEMQQALTEGDDE